MTEHDPLQEAVDKLPGEIEPPRDLWPGIQRRLAGEPEKVVDLEAVRAAERRGWQRGLLAAAAALLVFLAGWGLARFDGSGSEAPVVVDRGTAPDAAAPLELPNSSQLDAEYAQAQRELFASFETEELDPEIIELIRRNLDTIDSAVQEIRAALEDRPEDARLHRQLTTEIRRRSDVLRRAAAIRESI